MHSRNDRILTNGLILLLTVQVILVGVRVFQGKLVGATFLVSIMILEVVLSTANKLDLEYELEKIRRPK